MKIENSFEVAAPPEAAWELLMDVPRVIPCMPGATLTETVDDDHWKAAMAVKLGPIGLNFVADIARETADVSARQGILSAHAREAKGRGSAQATITSSLVEQEGGTRVDIATDLALTGPVAQYGRGMVQAVAAQLTAQFAACLQKQLEPPAETVEEPEPSAEPAQVAPTQAAPVPVSGLRLGLKALADLMIRPFRRSR